MAQDSQNRSKDANPGPLKVGILGILGCALLHKAACCVVPSRVDILMPPPPRPPAAFTPQWSLVSCSRSSDPAPDSAMASHAAEIDYGGETVGTTSFPRMGSGAFANQGWQKAAYQRQIYYYPQAGGSAWAALTASQAWPNCYTAQVVNYASPWNETLWYGGPGGNC